jgi:teichuronic acid biosynthesis glycosyltransferase TuaH
MIRVLLVPSSDYLGHPFPQRHNQIFERLNDNENFEVHVARFRLFEKPKLATTLKVHELSGSPSSSVSSYYLRSMVDHALEIRKIIRQESIDMVVLSNLSVPFAYSLMDQLSGMRVPYLFDLPDYYPTSAAGYLSNLKSFTGSFLVGTFDVILRYILRRSVAVTAPSHKLIEYASNTGISNAVYIPNGISNDFLTLYDGKQLRSKLGFAKQDFVAGYIGSVEFWLDLKTLIKGLAIAKKTGVQIKFLIVGKGLHTDYSAKINDYLKEANMEKSTSWLDFIPYAEVPKYIAALDVGLIPFDALNPTAYYAAPNKMWEYLSQKKSVISSPIPEAILNQDSVLLSSTPDEYANTILSIHQNASWVRKRVSNGYNKALTSTWENSTQAFANLITSCTQNSVNYCQVKSH